MKNYFASIKHLARTVITRSQPSIQKPDPKDYSTIGGVGSVVPCQIEAYFLALNLYVDERDTVLDVGFGLGYGLNILAIKASEVSGVDVDPKVLEYCTEYRCWSKPTVENSQAL